MITARPAARSRSPEPTVEVAPPPCQSRHSRRHERQRRVKEQLLIVAVLAVLLIITVVLLGLQWLNSTSSATSFLGAALHRGAPT